MPDWYVYLSVVIALAGASYTYWHITEDLDKEDPSTWVLAGVAFVVMGSLLLFVWPLLVVLLAPYGIYRWSNRDRR